MRRPAVPKPGDPIKAEHVAYILQELEDMSGVAVVPPLAISDDGSIYLADAPGFWIQVTAAATGTAYPWTRQQCVTGGSFMASFPSGTPALDPAYELNGSTTVPANTYVRAWRDPATAEVRFLYGACS